LVTHSACPISGARRYCGAVRSISGGIAPLGTSLYATLVPIWLALFGLTIFRALLWPS
jgi:hypothetical protein